MEWTESRTKDSAEPHGHSANLVRARQTQHHVPLQTHTSACVGRRVYSHSTMISLKAPTLRTA